MYSLANMTKINDNQLTIQHLSNNEIMMNWNQKCLIYIEREIPHHCCCSQKIFFCCSGHLGSFAFFYWNWSFGTCTDLHNGFGCVIIVIIDTLPPCRCCTCNCLALFGENKRSKRWLWGSDAHKSYITCIEHLKKVIDARWH